MPSSVPELHDEAATEYDAAFDWYLSRSPDAALKFDAEVDRARAQINQAPQRVGGWSAPDSQVPAETISLYSDLPRSRFREYSGRRSRPHPAEGPDSGSGGFS